MKDFSINAFGKTLHELEYQDLLAYFTEEHGESNHIEFKAFSLEHGNYNRDFKGVIRTICGLLNSEGGIVIWGAPLGVEDPETHEKKFQGDLAPVPEYKEKDVVINKVSDSISPLPVGIRVQILQRAANEIVYVFEVQPSPYKPHQFENIYLVRLDGQTKPAPYYFIEALFRKISYPNIEGYVKFNTANFHVQTGMYYIDFTILLFNFSKLQNEESVIYRLMTTVGHFQSEANSEQPFMHSGKEPLLHFGTPIMSAQRIIMSPQAMEENDHILYLLLNIAGKKSPAKTSEYNLNLRNINLENPNDTTNLVIERSENELVSDRQDNLGKTRETTLFSALGRNP